MQKKVTPSKRCELEITSVNEMYLQAGRLKVIRLEEGYRWFDVGTPDSLKDASNFFRTMEEEIQ